MKKDRNLKIVQATSFLLSAIAVLVSFETLGPSEFSGGRLTGSFMTLAHGGLYLFVLALFLTLLFRRVAAGLAVLACLLSLPLYFYLIFPGAFHRFFKGEYSIPVERTVVWSPTALVDILTIAVALALCVYNLLSFKVASDQEAF